MVTVKVFGTVRLETGIKEFTADVKDVRSLYPLLLEKAKERDPHTKIRPADLKGCYVMVNGEQKNARAKLMDGDVVMLMSPVCGG